MCTEQFCRIIIGDKSHRAAIIANRTLYTRGIDNFVNVNVLLSLVFKHEPGQFYSCLPHCRRRNCHVLFLLIGNNSDFLIFLFPIAHAQHRIRGQFFVGGRFAFWEKAICTKSTSLAVVAKFAHFYCRFRITRRRVDFFVKI